MGFWDSLKAIGKVVEEQHAASTQMAYTHGKLAAYKRGYEDGRAERVRAGRD
jgi:hypothetical protein